MQCTVQCGGCSIMLMYPQGAANVRCSQCQHVTSVQGSTRPRPAQPPKAQLQCSGCQLMLMYPRFVENVQCAVCGTVNSAAHANTVAQLQCVGCRTWLIYAYGARSVKCAVCNTVSQAVEDTMSDVQSTPPKPPKPQEPTEPEVGEPAIVYNPPTVDEKGNKVEDVVLGYQDTGK